MQKIIPNSTQIHNAILDYLLPFLNEAETKCVLYICRRTFGFHKKKDRISLSQFVKGIKDKDGNWLDLGTGLSRQSVVDALSVLSGVELVKKAETAKGNFYQINLKIDIQKAIQEIYVAREQIKYYRKHKPKQTKLFKQTKQARKRQQKSSPDGINLKWMRVTMDKEAKDEINKKLEEFKKNFGRVPVG